MAEAGVDMTTLSTIMGNNPTICFRHYIRFSPDHLKKAMARLDNDPASGPRSKNEEKVIPFDSAVTVGE